MKHFRNYLTARRYNWTSTGPSGCDTHCIDHPCGPCRVPELKQYQDLKTLWSFTVRRLKRQWCRWHTLDYSRLTDLEVDGIDTRDYPDFCDAYISSGSYRTWYGRYRELTDAELDRLNEDSDFVYETVQNYLY